MSTPGAETRTTPEQAAMSPAGPWTPQAVRQFVNTEVLRYQKIQLPFGISTPGKDRKQTCDVIFRDGLEGRTLLDVGCSLGYFCLEALARGARRALGWDVDPDALRQARVIADMLGSPADYEQRDIETVDPTETFDVVLCLNVLHHVRDPIAVLDKLIKLTGERLVLELASVESTERRKFGLSRWRAQILARSPVLVAGEAQTLDSSATPPRFSFTRRGIRNLLEFHRTDLGRVEILDSEFKDRFLVILHRRRIGHLVVLSGPMSSGKTGLAEAIRANRFPEIGIRLGIQDLPAWPYATAAAIGTLNEPAMDRLVLHYDFLRPYLRRAKTFERDEALDLLQVAREVSFVTVWTPPERLRRQHAARIEKREPTGLPRLAGALIRRLVSERVIQWASRLPLAGRLVRAITRTPHQRLYEVLKAYRQPAQVIKFYERWFEFCDRQTDKTGRHVIVEYDRDVKFLSRAEWEEITRKYVAEP